MLMSLYIFMLIASEQQYMKNFTAFSVVYWQASWVCRLAMTLSHLSYEFSLYMLTITSAHRVIVTKYALANIHIKASQITMLFIAGVLANIVLVGINAFFHVTPGTRSHMCLFIYTEKTSHLVHWVNLICNVILITLICLNNAIVGIFLAQRKMPGKGSTKKQTRMKILLVRMFITTAGNVISCLIISITQLLLITDMTSEIGIMTDTVLISLLTNPIINPLINTYSTVKFKQSIINIFCRKQ
jgi:hypothetical protein